MKIKLTHYVMTALLGVAFTAELHAQLVADGGTLNFIGTTNLAGDLIVGTSGGNTLLTILAPGTVTNAAGMIGFNASSTDNQVRVLNSGAIWQNNGNLFVGFDGSGNQLEASNGGVMASISGYVGFHTTANNNMAVVTGPGSLWSNSGNINLGYFGSGNQLVVSNSGTVQAGNTYVGYTGSISNLAVVSGAGSLWTNRFIFYLGVFGSGNQLVVSNGGVVANGDGFVGRETSSTNNLAVVSGAGSLWTNRGNFFLGSDGSGNRMVVTNGGTLQAIGVFVGLNVGSTNNRAIVDGGNLIVTNSGGFGTLDVRRGTNVLNAGLIQTDSLVLNNGAGFFDFNGGTLITHGGTVNNGQPFVVGASGTTAAIFDVRSNFEPLVVNNDFTLGANMAAGNQLLLTNGGALRVTGTTYVGTDASSTNNLVTISGPNSLWTNSSEFYFGYLGSGNHLVVGDGGALADGFAYIGLASSSSNNVALVTGPGSTWTNTGDLRIGGFGGGNQLVVSNGGVVVSGIGYFAANSGESSNNVAMVTGPNSRWILNSVLNLGYLGGGNQLVVSDGGTVQAPGTYIGANASSTNNRAIVDGGNLIVTNSGGTAMLDIRRGTNVLNTGLIQADNLLLNNSTGFLEFNGGMLIMRGGTVDNGQDFVVGTSGTNPAILNLESGALTLNNGFKLGANTATAGNQLLLTNGGTLSVTGESSVGANAIASNNLAVVSGTGSLWTTSEILYVGAYSSGNQLVVSNGGVVTSANDNIVGFSAVSSNNTAMVTGPGSLWTNSANLFVGYTGRGSRLVVSNGATVQTVSAYVGTGLSSTGNRMTVDGGNLIVTNSGGSGTLEIRRGTNVFNAGFIVADKLNLNYSSGFFEFNGGTLLTSGSTVNNGQAFVVGNGSSPATLNLTGNGLHTFTDGLVISTAATLKGNGTVDGPLTVQSGGSLAPGASVGLLLLNNSPVLQGSVLMEISKTGATLTNDQIQVMASLTCGGNLVVSDLGPDALTAGDSFPLFSASSYGGAFKGMSLPPLNPGLMWTNQLLLNGSIAVVPQGQLSISGLVKSGTNLEFTVSGGSPGGAYTLLTSTNVTLPLSSWTTNSTGNFDWMGNITLANGINPNEAQRYFSVRMP